MTRLLGTTIHATNTSCKEASIKKENHRPACFGITKSTLYIYFLGENTRNFCTSSFPYYYYV
jgi:hypothetical protein